MKINCEVIQIFHEMPRAEIVLLLYLVRCQDVNTGAVKNLYAHDATKCTGISKQSFYYALRGLERRQIITILKNDVAYDIYIKNNLCQVRKEGGAGSC